MEIKKVMISQPMRGKSDNEIMETRNRVISYLRTNGFDFIDNLFISEYRDTNAMINRGVVNSAINLLAKSLDTMSLCHCVYFCKGWEAERGCRIEHAAANDYGLEIIYEQ
jgi:hypothetical protein